MQEACSAACAVANEPSGMHGCSRGHGRPHSRADMSPSVALWGKRGTCKSTSALHLANEHGIRVATSYAIRYHGSYQVTAVPFHGKGVFKDKIYLLNTAFCLRQMLGSSLHSAGSTRIPFKGPTLVWFVLSARKDHADRVRWTAHHCKNFCTLP